MAEYIYTNREDTHFIFDELDFRDTFFGCSTFIKLRKFNPIRTKLSGGSNIVTYKINDFLTIKKCFKVIDSKNSSNTTIHIIVHGTPDKPYVWNGCSIKVSIFDMLFGTPEGRVNLKTGFPKTYHASMVHDILYQFSKETKLFFTRKTVDKMFLKELRKQKFRSAKLYYYFVRLFGILFWNQI